MFNNKAIPAEFSAAEFEFGDRLDALISAGRHAGVSPRSMVDALDGRVDALCFTHATTAPADASSQPRRCPKCGHVQHKR